MKKHKLALILLVSIVLSLPYFMSLASAASGSSSTDWATFHNNLNHTGYTTSNGSTNSTKLLWTYETRDSVWSSPAVVNGTLFVGSKDGYIYALNASNGELVWKFGPAGGEVDSSPSVYNGRVYYSADDGFVYCIDIATGQPIWIKWVGGYVRSSPAVVEDRVYVGSGAQNFYCLNATDGNKIWTFPTKYRVDSSPAVANGVVYFATDDYFVYAVNASTGSEIWHHHTGSTLMPPSIYNGSLYIGSYEGYVYDLNASTGAQIWRYQTQDEVVSTPAIAYGAIYVGSEDNNVYCLNASTGQKIWQTPTGYWVWSSPAVADGKVYVGSEDYNIYCLNAYTGAKEWSYETGSYVDSSPAFVNNTLYVGSHDGYVYAFALYNSSVEVSWSQISSPISWTTFFFDAIALTIGVIIIFVAILFAHSTWRANRNAKTENFNGQKTPWFSAHTEALCLLGVLAFSVLLFVNLQNGFLWAADEQTYSQMAMHMVRNQDYLTPWANGALAIWTGKPPLTMWLMALSYQIFGVNNFATRFWTPVFGTLALVVVFYMGKKFYNVYVGFLAALILGTFTTFFAFASHAMLDVPLIFFMLASIYFLLLSEEKKKSNLYAVLSGVFFGLALLTKQIDALFIPLIVLIYFLVTTRSIRFLFTKRFILLFGIALLIFGPWLIYMNQRFGWLFWECYFKYSIVSRATSPIEGHVGSYLYYFNYLATSENLLWVILLPFAVGLSVFNSVVNRLKGDNLILVWMTVVLAVFTFVQTKIYYYILPAYPAFAITIGNLIYRLSTKIQRHRQEKKEQ